jgi:hypothetical protein
LSRDVLALTSSAYAVSCAMMTVPVLVFHDVVDIVLVIGSKTESAELTLAFVVDALLLLLSNVETLVQVGEKSL